jgi:transcription elongation factor GreA
MSNFFTRASHTRLLGELERLRTQELPSLSRAKNAAAAEGDLSENAEYQATREQLTMVQRRIYELEEQISSPRFIEDLPISCDSVSIGTTVRCLDLETHLEVVYTILGPADAAPEKHIISFQAPLGRGLIGKEIDDEVSITIPAGKRHLRVLDIQRFDV